MSSSDSNPIDEAILHYIETQSNEAMEAMKAVFWSGTLFIPLAAEPTGPKVAFILERTLAGDGSIPAFTSLDHLREWAPDGGIYLELQGSALFLTAIDMPEVSQIVVNGAGVPRGVITRSDFERHCREESPFAAAVDEAACSHGPEIEDEPAERRVLAELESESGRERARVIRWGDYCTYEVASLAESGWRFSRPVYAGIYADQLQAEHEARRWLEAHCPP